MPRYNKNPSDKPEPLPMLKRKQTQQSPENVPAGASDGALRAPKRLKNLANDQNPGISAEAAKEKKLSNEAIKEQKLLGAGCVNRGAAVPMEANVGLAFTANKERLNICLYQLSIGNPAWVKGKYTGTLQERLTAEILDFVATMSLSEKELEERREIVSRITDIVRARVPGASVETFGSVRTTLALRDSDIDLVIFESSPQYTDGPHPLQKWKNPLRNLFRSLMLIKAKTPILQGKHRETGISIDISYNQQNGMSSCEVTQKLLAEDPHLRPLVFVLKQFLRNRDLNNPASAGVGSYAITLWVASFLKMHAHLMPGRYEAGSINLGTIFLDFLKTFCEGGSFDFEHLGMDAGSSEEPICDCPPKSSALYIRDAAPPYNNVAIACNRPKLAFIRTHFRAAYEEILYADRALKPKSLLSYILYT
ncbi:Non-canonical poly(A) RNA polymerase papd5 [Geranomyces michiganensis]|nr:Non-canonical poly(A) RNA polymerase papd5 [Geranomyces michiganensis]